MKFEQISKENMNALEALAQTNVKISEARVALSELKDSEASYLEEREKKVIEQLEKLLVESDETLKKVISNYKEVQDLCNLATSFANSLIEFSDVIEKVQTSFETKSKEFEAEVETQIVAFEKVKKAIVISEILLENDKKTIIQKNKEIEVRKKKLLDREETVERTIERLKNNRI